MKPNETLYAGEAQLAGWSDTHNGGPKLTVWLPSSDDLEKFRSLTMRKGNTAGHRVMLAVVEIGDDEKPVPPPKVPNRAKGGDARAEALSPERRSEIARQGADARWKPGPYCMEAIELCGNALFQKWAESEAGISVRSDEQAKQFMLGVLGIGSRKEIDGNEEVSNAFVEMIRIPFLHWQREQVDK